MKKTHGVQTSEIEGLRTRKRRQTRERITESALTLFFKHGFEAVTIDDIAAAADISKRSFFDYFPTKEEVIFAWQDDFGSILATAVADRPQAEPLARVVEEAMASSIAATANPRSLAVARLIRSSPLLQARDQLKYARLEETLAAALAKREDGSNHSRAQLLAMIVIGSLRLFAGQAQEKDPGEFHAYTKEVFRQIWEALAGFAAEAGQAISPRSQLASDPGTPP